MRRIQRCGQRMLRPDHAPPRVEHQSCSARRDASIFPSLPGDRAATPGQFPQSLGPPHPPAAVGGSALFALTSELPTSTLTCGEPK